MSTVTPCTVLCGRPAAATPVSSSGSRIQLSRMAAAAAAAVGPCFQRKPRRPLSVCLASPKGDHGPKGDLPPFNISPVALVQVAPPSEERWQLEEDEDGVRLKFEVPGLSNEELAVEIDEDVLLVKNKKKAMGEAKQRPYDAGVYARLLLPAGFSRESVQAELAAGMLTVTIAKVKEHARRRISVHIQVK